MRNPLPFEVEKGRITSGYLASSEKFGCNGAFEFRLKGGESMLAIVSDGEGWEHVSVSLRKKSRCPTWEEMCEIKDLFWNDNEVVVQYHPRKSDYIDLAKFTLHLWRPVVGKIRVPPLYLV